MSKPCHPYQIEYFVGFKVKITFSKARQDIYYLKYLIYLIPLLFPIKQLIGASQNRIEASMFL